MVRFIKADIEDIDGLGRDERQSARMSKITNDGLTGSGTGCFITVPICGRQRVKEQPRFSTFFASFCDC